MSEDRAGPIVECATAILTQVPLELCMATGSDLTVRTAVEDKSYRHATESVGEGPLRLIPTQTHLAESFVLGTGVSVPLSSSTPQRQLSSLNNLLQKSVRNNC